jgi:salicylate hydroxylase
MRGERQGCLISGRDGAAHHRHRWCGHRRTDGRAGAGRQRVSCPHLEKTGRLEEAGAGLQLSPNATRILIGLGLQPRLAPHVTTPASVSIMTARSGGEVIRLPLGSARDDAPYWLVHRADLQSALLGAVTAHPDIELRLGCPVDNLRATPAGIIVNGESALALIGADGAWSFVRRQLFPETQPHFSGLIAWRGTLETSRLDSDLVPHGVQLWMGPKAHLVVYPVSSGERINMVAIMPGAAMQPGSSDAGDASEIRRHFAASRWPANARAMIESVDNWRRWPLFTMPDGGMWHEGSVALLGDAAHAMLPFAAQGAGMAIEDAAVLAQCLGAGRRRCRSDRARIGALRRATPAARHPDTAHRPAIRPDLSSAWPHGAGARPRHARARCRASTGAAGLDL